MSVASSADLVIVDWTDLKKAPLDGSETILAALERAFGSIGTGIIAIKNVPGFVDAKQAFLPKAHVLATQPIEYLEEKLTDADSLYNSGWSHGKEKLGDKPDYAKGSFYYNPITDQPGTEEDRAKYPLSYPRNIWPDEERIPGFQEAACKIGKILKEAVVALTPHIDALAQSKVPGYPQGFLYHALKDTDKVKARLLYYFPLKKQSDDNGNATITSTEDSWIGWHNDSGFLTALAGDLYVDHCTRQSINIDDHPENDAAGLYVVNRQDETIHIRLPADCLAIQIGECAQIVTGGAVSATPHCVRGARGSGIARISLPCFVDAPPSFPLSMPAGATRKQVLQASSRSQRVPPLDQRWTVDGMSFGDFLQNTFSMYYEWTKPRDLVKS